MDDEVVEHITKIEAARRQLKAAIRLFFQDGDSVSIHTLASAAQEILDALLKRTGKGGLVHHFKDWIVPGKEKEFYWILNAARNSFKHGSRDPDQTVEFRPALSEFVLFDCVQMYQALRGRHIREGFIYLAWFLSVHPDVLKPGALRETLESSARVLGDVRSSKADLLWGLDHPEKWDSRLNRLEFD